MTLPTTDQIILAVFVVGACLIAGMLTRHAWVRGSIQRQQDQLSITPGDGDPAHFWIDTRASFGANVMCVLWSALGAYLAVAILSGDLTWSALFRMH